MSGGFVGVSGWPLAGFSGGLLVKVSGSKHWKDKCQRRTHPSTHFSIVCLQQKCPRQINICFQLETAILYNNLQTAIIHNKLQFCLTVCNHIPNKTKRNFSDMPF